MRKKNYQTHGASLEILGLELKKPQPVCYVHERPLKEPAQCGSWVSSSSF